MKSANSNISGFFASCDFSIQPQEAQLQLLRSSEEHPFVLYKSVERGRIVVIKAIVEGERQNPLYRAMLRKEFEIGRSLNHPNIREYYSLIDHPHLGLAVEMEWIDGVTLDELLAECSRDAKLCDSIVKQLMDAVGFMHIKQVVHRDLKPENILVTKGSYIVKLIDFSLSDSASHIILKEGAGTALYAAPEEMSSKVSNFTSDIYSLGVLLSKISSRKRYRQVAERAVRVNPKERYESVEQMSESLFAHSGAGLWYTAAAVAAIILLALFLLVRRDGNAEILDAKQDFVESQVIEDIFLQATELLEEPDSL